MKNLQAMGSNSTQSVRSPNAWRLCASPERISCHLNPVGRKLLHLIEHKQSQKIVSVDPSQAVQVAHQQGPSIVLLSITGKPDRALRELADHYQFLILSPVVVEWADLIAVHTIKEIKNLRLLALNRGQGIVYTGRHRSALHYEDVLAATTFRQLIRDCPNIIYINYKLLIVE